MSDSNPFNLPQEFIDSLSGAMLDGEAALPFYAPVVWWKHGSPSLKATVKNTSGVQYFGGWAISADDLDDTGQAPPYGFVPETWTNREGNEFNVYASRVIYAAPIVRRKKWEANDYGRKRSAQQILAMMGQKNGANPIERYGPIVISANGLKGKDIEDAFGTWDRLTRAARLEYNIPSNLFYTVMGTFGDTPNFKDYGSQQTSKGTPCVVPINSEDKVDLTRLKKVFVGAEVVEEMSGLKALALDWSEAWKEDKESAAAPDLYEAPPPIAGFDEPF